MTALIVEDDAFFAQLLAEWLEELGLAVYKASSLQGGIANLDKGPFSVAIVDLMLPNDPLASGVTPEETRGGFLAGLAFAKRLLRQHPASPVVLLTGTRPEQSVWEWANEHNIPIVEKLDGQAGIRAALERAGIGAEPKTPRAFIVHGRDESALADLRKYITTVLRWQEPLVLRDMPSFGKTIIEKFEETALRVDCVFVLLTPDGTAVTGVNDAKRRSRQNVIFELGFFYAHFGRHAGRVVLFHKGDVEIPSDIHGIVWVDISSGFLAAHDQIEREVTHLVDTRPAPVRNAKP